MVDLRVVLATPHGRHDGLEAVLASREGWVVHRIRDANELTLATLDEFAPHWVLFPHWSYRIPAEIHERYHCVIFHETDVPYGRGGSPVQNLIARGHTETVMTAMECVDEMDAGPVYMKRPLSLFGTAEEILLRAADLIAEMSIELLEVQPDPVPQRGDATVFTRRRPSQSRLTGDEALVDVYDKIRMLDADGYPHAFLEIGDLRLEFTRASLRPGEVVADVRIRRRVAESGL